ncbi:MAG: DUF2914 domain-containing protein [Proteobacteria bacterium]|nr:DUF2914 domain-containing protein [Pseudomonadota bacterium]
MKRIALFAAAALFAAPAFAEETETTEPDPVSAADPTPAPVGEVARAVFTSGISDREPVDELDALANDVELVFFFTDVRALAGGEVIHRWEYAGEVVAEVPFAVGGDRWRVWSSKRLPPESLGEWSVIVLDGDGNPLASETLVYAEAAAPEEEAMEAEKSPAAAAEPSP